MEREMADEVLEAQIRGDAPHNRLSFGGRRRLPMIRQAAAAECSLSCLAMVSAYHGHEADLNTLRRKFSISMNGTSLRGLMSMADRLGLQSRAIKLEIEGLRVLATPCILHWNMSHFVVLKKVTSRKVVIHDPAVGVRVLTPSQVSAQFTGVALELTPATLFERTRERGLELLTFVKGAVGLKRFLVQLLLLSCVLQIFVLLSPLYLQTVLDKILLGGDGAGLLVGLAIGFGFILLFKELVGTFRSYVVTCLGRSFSFQLNNNLLRHMLKLPLAFFQTRHMGDVVSRFGSLEPIRKLLTEDLIGILVDGLMVVTALALMFSYSLGLSLVVLVFVAIYYALSMLTYAPIRRLTEDRIASGAVSSSNFMETVRAIQCIKIFGRELDRQQLWQQQSIREHNLDLKIARWTLSITGVQGILFGLENILVIYLAAHAVIVGSLTIGMLTAFLAYKLQFTGGVSNLVSKLIELKMLGVHMERIADVALSEPENDKTERDDSGIARIDPSSIRGKLELNDISFRYADAEPLIIRGVSFVVNPGESVVLTGPSGCGKSTLMKIAMGLLEPETGRVRVDDCDIRQLGVRNYRKLITSVMQDDELLSGTIADNIAFFDPQPDQVKIEACARLAAIHSDIQKMPMGYSSLIGDMGSTLSGGQKQRVLLARALYGDPKILFLDEATSFLDAGTEAMVSEAIGHLKITRIIIAHRLETIRTAERVIALDGIEPGAYERPRKGQNDVEPIAVAS